MVVDDTEDHTEAVILKGIHAGELKTVALDSENRILGRMLTGIDSIVNNFVVKTTISILDTVESEACPSGMYRKITHIITYNNDSFTSIIGMGKITPSADAYELQFSADIPKLVPVIWSGEIWLDEGEYIRCSYVLCNIGDDLNLTIHGTQIPKV